MSIKFERPTNGSTKKWRWNATCHHPALWINSDPHHMLVLKLPTETCDPNKRTKYYVENATGGCFQSRYAAMDYCIWKSGKWCLQDDRCILKPNISRTQVMQIIHWSWWSYFDRKHQRLPISLDPVNPNLSLRPWFASYDLIRCRFHQRVTSRNSFSGHHLSNSLEASPWP